jgi:hypothetical protein
VTLVADRAGIWVLHLRAPPGMRSFSLSYDTTTASAWTAPGAAGEAVLFGAPDAWVAASTGAQGYVVSGDYWRSVAGSYRAAVRLSTSGPVNVEVWDATANALLWRRSVTAGPAGTVSGAFDLPRAKGVPVDRGWGPFRILASPPRPGDDLEVRVWSPGRTTVDVYTISIRPSTPAP